MPEHLPAMVSPAGVVVRLITADHLLEAAGLDPETLDGAEVEQLATFDDNARHLAAITSEARQRVSDELVRRLDRKGRWTLHEAGFTIKAPSPEAGTTAYDTAALREQLDRLVADDVIDEEAAHAALERVTPEPYDKQRPAGIKALLKLGGKVAEAIKGCERDVDPPRRRATVKRSDQS